MIHTENDMEEQITLEDLKGKDAIWLIEKMEQMTTLGAVNNFHSLIEEYRYKDLPRTYDECFEYIGLSQFFDKPVATGYKAIEVEAFQQILICREAYRKFAEKLPKDRWRVAYIVCDEVGIKVMDDYQERGHLLTFPVELCHKFLDNFKEKIEECRDFI